MSEPPPGYDAAVDAVAAAVQDWLSTHPGSWPTVEFKHPRVIATGDLRDVIAGHPALAELVNFDDAGMELARYVAARVPGATLLMLVTVVEVMCTT